MFLSISAIATEDKFYTQNTQDFSIVRENNFFTK